MALGVMVIMWVSNNFQKLCESFMRSLPIRCPLACTLKMPSLGDIFARP